MSDAPAHLSVEMKHRAGALDIDVAFQLTAPWTVLFGPSGSGKSTILRAIAGLVRPDHARIALHLRHHSRPSDRISLQVATDTAQNIFIAPHKRAVRWSAQRPAPFPHMTVRQNLRFASDPHCNDVDHLVDSALERFQLTALAEANPGKLSGGEQQRVALARATIASNGRLLLLDEPFTGLDVPSRDDLVQSLRGWFATTYTPVLSVTHDIGEAFALGAEVIRLQHGRVVQQGPVAVVLAVERDQLLAQLG